jgi:hypothetical protein
MTELTAMPAGAVSAGSMMSHRRRPRAGVGVIVLAIVVIASGLAGAAIERYMIVARLGPLRPFVMSSDPMSPADAHRVASHVADELDLSADQQGQVEAIIARRMADLRGMRGQVRTQLLAMIDSTMTEIDNLLTPAQRVKFLEMRRKRGYVDSAGHLITVPPPPT